LLADGALREDGVGLLLRLHEPGGVVDPAGALQRAVGPEHHAPVALRPGEADAPVDQLGADAEPPRPLLPEKQAGLRDALPLADAVDRAGPLAVELRDPGALELRVVVGEKIGEDPGDQRLEVLVPSLDTGVELRMPVEHPAVVARTGGPDLDPSLVERLAQDLANAAHRLDQPSLLLLGPRTEQLGEGALPAPVHSPAGGPAPRPPPPHLPAP